MSVAQSYTHLTNVHTNQFQQWKGTALELNLTYIEAESFDTTRVNIYLSRKSIEVTKYNSVGGWDLVHFGNILNDRFKGHPRYLRR